MTCLYSYLSKWCQFQCCAVLGAGDYASTAWQRDLGEESNSLQLPLTCCALNNTHTLDSFLDPHPRDLRKCQDLESYAEGFRYSEVYNAEFFQYKSVCPVISGLWSIYSQACRV